MRKSIPFLVILACVVLSGCFTRDEPFYEESQIVQSPQLQEAPYKNIAEGRDDGSKWFVTLSLDSPGKYEFIIQESDVTVKLLGTLFRVNTNLFLDLYPLTDSGVYHVGGAVSVTEMLRSAMYKPLHVIWKVELSDDV